MTHSALAMVMPVFFIHETFYFVISLMLTSGLDLRPKLSGGHFSSYLVGCCALTLLNVQMFYFFSD